MKCRIYDLCLLVFLLLSCTTLTAQIALAFSGTPTLTGTAGTIGAKYTYPNVGTSGPVTIKAVVEIIAISGASLDNIDGPVSAGGLDNAFQPVISGSQTSGNCWSIQFRISFLNATTNASISLSSFRASGIDIDGNGSSLREYNTFINPNSYTLDNPTNLTVTKNASAFKFQSPSTSYAGIALTQTNVAVTCLYTNRSSVDLIIGSCCVGGSCSAASGSGRQHSINFYDAVTYNTPTVVLPVTLLQFSGSRVPGGVKLNWSTTDETDFSNFILQRSSDGLTYADIAIIAAGASNHVYDFTDRIAEEPVAYYRLKMIDIDGRFNYSHILRISPNTGDTPSLSISPNPVSADINLTYFSRSNQRIKIHIIDANGRLINSIDKRVSTGANILSVHPAAEMVKGIYFLQVLSNEGVKTVKLLHF